MYLGSIKSCTGYCDKDIAAQIGMAKKRMLELTNIWKDRAVPNKLTEADENLGLDSYDVWAWGLDTKKKWLK